MQQYACILLAISIPLYSIGIVIDGYDASLALLAILLIWISLPQKSKANPTTLLLYYAFILWSFTSAALRHSPPLYAPSLLSLILCSAPLILINFSIDDTYKRRLINAFSLGALITFPLAAYDILSTTESLPLLENVLNLPILSNGTNSTYGSITRVRALMSEPAHYAIFLCYCYAIHDSRQAKRLNIRYSSAIKFTSLFFIVFTFSLSGIFVLLTYLATTAITQGKTGILRFAKFTIVATASVVATGIITTVFLDVPLLQIIDAYSSRFQALGASALSGSFLGTYGERGNAMLVTLGYWKDVGLPDALIGTGYANHEIWLINQFGHLEHSELGRGRIPNAFAAIGISTGIVGLSFFLSLIISISRSSNNKLPWAIVSMWIITYFAYGNVIDYFVWSLALISKLTTSESACRKRGSAINHPCFSQ